MKKTLLLMAALGFAFAAQAQTMGGMGGGKKSSKEDAKEKLASMRAEAEKIVAEEKEQRAALANGGQQSGSTSKRMVNVKGRGSVDVNYYAIRNNDAGGKQMIFEIGENLAVPYSCGVNCTEYMAQLPYAADKNYAADSKITIKKLEGPALQSCEIAGDNQGQATVNSHGEGIQWVRLRNCKNT